MKICLYSPYVPKHLGGGEKYFFDVAKSLVELGHQVAVAVTCDLNNNLTYCSTDQFLPADQQIPSHQEIRQRYEVFLGYSLAAVSFIQTPINSLASFWQKLNWTRQWDVFYYVTDGSFFFSLAKKNVVHIQIPFTNSKRGLRERLKLWNWSVKNTNSQFTKKVIEKYWHTRVNEVHYPMIVPPALLVPGVVRKEKMILHVGRFFRHLHSKRQDVLVDIFKKMYHTYPNEMRGWELVLIGAIEDEDYVNEVKDMAVGLPVRILQVSHQELWNYYQLASIYWHATGFGIDEVVEPSKMEHFGISTVEAMSMGCVPVVIGQGGQVEIVGEKMKNLLWLTVDECMAKTLEMMTQTQLRQEMSKLAVEQSRLFNADVFKQTLVRMIS